MIAEPAFSQTPSSENPPQKKTAYETAGINIEHSEHKHLSEMDRSRFEVFGSSADGIYESYKAVINWLKLPYVQDNFGEDHMARREWFKTLSKEENLEMLKNKFRNNPVAVLAMNLNNLKMLLKRSGHLPDPDKLFPDNKPNFIILRQSHNPAERKAVMQQIESQCEAIIDYLESYINSQKIAA
ncbi:MAG: hypothetical protein WC750_00560 [Patescibacteria group bacterium]|jgi:hypothetical protein